MKLHATMLLVAAFCFLATSAGWGTASICDAVAGNLVANCGFETGDYTDWTHSGYTGYTSVSSDDPNSGTYESKIGPYTYQGISGISQTIATAPGTYHFSFYLAHGGDCTNTPDCSEALVQWNGITLMDELNATNYGYVPLTFLVSATGPSTIAFGFTSNPNYYYLDDVVVTPSVPEPGSLMLFGTGIVGLAGVVRRKLRM